MKNSTFELCLAFAIPVAMIGCVGTDKSLTENKEMSTGNPGYRNSSDAGKPDYRPAFPGEIIQKGIGDASEGFIVNPVVPPLSKTAAASGYIGYLSPNGIVTFTMDAENTNNLTSVQEPYYDNVPRPWSFKPVKDQDSGISGIKAPLINGVRDARLKFHRSNLLSELPQGGEDYVVLRLSASCPTNGIPFARIFDNEDYNNHNSNFSISPSYQSSAPSSGITRMEFCFVPSNPSGSGFATAPWAGSQNGVFVPKFHLGTPVSQRACPSEVNQSSFFVLWDDDEDNMNQNSFDWYGMDPAYRTRALYIIQPPNNNGDYNTTMFFCKNN